MCVCVCGCGWVFYVTQSCVFFAPHMCLVAWVCLHFCFLRGREFVCIFFLRGRENLFTVLSKQRTSSVLVIIIIMYIYHVLINALSTPMIHINPNMILCTHVEHRPTQTPYMERQRKMLINHHPHSLISWG